MKLGFGKKGGGEKKAKPAKRKSKGSSPDTVAQLKSMAINHVEKVVLGIIGLASLWIVYSGFKQERIQNTPASVQQDIANARNAINRDTWSEVLPSRQPEQDTFEQQATADTVSIDADDFSLPVPFHPILKEQEKRRTDPVLLAPAELEVQAGYGPLAMRETIGAGGAPSAFSGFRTEETPMDETSRPLPDKFRQKSRGEISMSAGNAVSRYFICITGLVPYREQVEAYRQAFEGAASFAPERDTPRYLLLGVERAEVAADGSQGEWVTLDTLKAMRADPRTWETSNDERVSREYLIPELVMPVPPLLFRDVNQWATHSKIPLESTDGSFGEGRMTVEEAAAEERESATDIFNGAGQFREGRSETNTELEGATEYENTGDRIEMALKQDFGLLRYYDFEVQPGKTYVYRVRFLLEDPNNPREYAKPPASACETSVLVRRQENASKNYRETPWSELTPPTTVPTGRSVFAGGVETPRLYEVPSNPRIRLPRRPGEEPVAKVLAVAWDSSQAMDVPALMDVRRGAVLNQTVTTEAINPSQANVITLTDYALKTDLLVLDIAGGEAIGRRGLEPVRLPGWVLVMDGNGQIRIHDEIGDFEDYDFYFIPEDEEAQMLRGSEERVENREAVEGREEVRGEPMEGGEGRRSRGR